MMEETDSKKPKKSGPLLSPLSIAEVKADDELERLPTARAERAVSVDSLGDALRILQDLNDPSMSLGSATSSDAEKKEGEEGDEQSQQRRKNTHKHTHKKDRHGSPSLPEDEGKEHHHHHHHHEKKRSKDDSGKEILLPVSVGDNLTDMAQKRKARRCSLPVGVVLSARDLSLDQADSAEESEKKTHRHHSKKHAKQDKDEIASSLVVVPQMEDRRLRKIKRAEPTSALLSLVSPRVPVGYEKRKAHSKVTISRKDKGSDGEDSDGCIKTARHIFQAAPNQSGLVLNTVCDVCGEKAPTLQCSVCGFMCHSVCECQAPPCICKSSVCEMEAMLSKKRVNFSKKSLNLFALRYAESPRDEVVTPSSSAFRTSKKHLKREGRKNPVEEEVSQPSQVNLMTAIQVQKELQDFTDQYSKFLPQIIFIQRVYRLSQFQHMRDTSAKRMQVVDEILDTERSYVEQLHTIIDKFQIPLTKTSPGKSSAASSAGTQSHGLNEPSLMRSCGSLALNPCGMNPRVLKTIFGNIQSLCSAIECTLKELEKATNEFPFNRTTRPVLGPVFIAQMSNIAQHVNYVLNFNDALDALSQAQRNPTFSKLLRELLRANKVVDLTDLLVVPVQHIPRYIILIERLLARTHVLHPDHQPLIQALRLVKKLAAYMNERRKMKETMQSLRNDFAGMQDVLSGPGRYLVMKGPLASYTPSRKMKIGFDYCFLFNDMLVAAKQVVTGESRHGKGEDFTPRYAVVLRIVLNERTVLLPTANADKKEVSKHCLFELEHDPYAGTSLFSTADLHPSSESTTKMSTTFSAPDEEAKSEWISNIRDILECIAEEHAPPHIKTFEETIRSD